MLRRYMSQLLFTQRGSYSVERLFAFNEYCRHTSVWRTLAVCFLFSIPPLFTSIALELIPLQDPLKGAKANYGAWMRQFFIAFVCSTAACVEINELVPRLALSAARILVVAFVTSCGYILVMFYVAICWTYPIPFSLVIGTIPCATFLIFFFLLAVGLRRFRSDALLRQQLLRQFDIINAQALITFVYPVFSAIYFRVPPHYKPFFVMLLPVIKFSMQQFFAWFANDLVDHQPGVVVFCVKVFNSLYSAKSMQSAGGSAHLTTFVIIAFDILDFAIILRHLHHEMTRTDQRLHNIINRRVLHSFTHPKDDQVLLEVVMKLCEEPGVLSSVMHDGAPIIRLQSTIRHALTTQRQSIIDRISRVEYERTQTPHTRATAWPMSSNLSQIVPVADGTANPVAAKNQSNQEMTLREKHDFVHAVLKMLFECEYYLLTQYVKCIVPTMYIIYIVIVSHLPSAEYYPELRGLTTHQNTAAIFNILLYTALEVVTFALLHAAIKWRCGFSPTYLLAFVLENQALEFQGRLFLWYVFLLELTLVHFGKHAQLCRIVLKTQMITFCFCRCGFLTSIRLGKIRQARMTKDITPNRTYALDHLSVCVLDA